MPERILIGVAWPYANGPLHMGHIAGCYLAADIFARYHRMKGNEVLMVSGSDAHGTPITIRADQEGVEPQEVLERYHEQFLDTWKRLGISFDLFTSTHTANHQEVVQDFFLRLKEQGYIYPDTMLLAYCAGCDRYLPDRYVEGTCPHCRNERARGDQCDNCGHTLDPIELVDPFCSICRDTPSFRDSEHFFLKLSAFQEPLLDWVNQQPHWRPNVANSTRSFLQGGLKDRAITRDLTWGVPVPLEGYDDKRIYVWFEAVIGYLSAAVEWASRSGHADAWTDYWKGGNARAYYFIGKDNIPFHSIIWPAMLMGYGGLNLPYDVPANEFLSLESRKFSTSQNWAIWVPDYLDRYDPDPLRYLLSINMPETGDTDFYLERVRAEEQRRARGDLRQPGEPGAAVHLPELRRPSSSGRRRSGGRRTRAPTINARRDGSRGRQPGPHAIPRRRISSIRLGAGVQSLPGRARALASDQDGPGRCRPRPRHHYPGAELPQGHACPVPAVQQPEAPRIPGFRRRRDQ